MYVPSKVSHYIAVFIFDHLLISAQEIRQLLCAVIVEAHELVINICLRMNIMVGMGRNDLHTILHYSGFLCQRNKNWSHHIHQ